MLRFAMPLAIAIAAIGLTQVALAQDGIANFYRGKQVTMMIGFAPGGSYDVSGRLVSRHITRHIPGNPSIVVQNLAGGGSLLLLNRLASVGEKDGSVIGLVSSGTGSTPILTPQAAKYDPRHFHFLGSPVRASLILLVTNKSPVQTLAQTKEREMAVGASAPGAAILDYPIIFNEIFGTKFKIIGGYEGAPQAGLAMERGEVDGLVGAPLTGLFATRWYELWKKGELKIVAQFGSKPDPRIPDVPLFFQPETEEHRQILTVVYARDEFGQPFVLPPGVPESRAKAMRAAFSATMRDPQFRADAEKMKVDLDPVSGEELQALAERIMATPPEVGQRIVQIISGGRK